MRLLNREQWLFCLQLGLAIMAAYFVTHGNDPANAVYAVLGAGLVTTPSIGEGLGVSKERIVGTLLGALVSLSAMWLDHPALALAVTVVVIGPLGVMLGGMAVARIAVTVAAVTVLLHTETAGTYGLLRFTNTAAGVAVALAVAFLLWPFSRHLSFFLALRSTAAAAASLAEQLAKGEAAALPLDGQRKLFMAISALPKSVTHAARDPLSYRQREHVREEGLLMVKIGVSLLATSLSLARGGAALKEADRAAIAACYRHLAARLHRVHHRLGGGQAAAAAQTSALTIDEADGAPLQLIRIAEELRAIDEWLDELERCLETYSAASFVPNKLRAKRG